MSILKALPRYNIIIYKPPKAKVRYCKLIRLPAIDIPSSIILFITWLTGSDWVNNPGKRELAELWKFYKEGLKYYERKLNIPIVNWKEKDMFEYFVKRKNFISRKRRYDTYVLYLKVNWKIFLEYLENWPRELLEKEKENSIARLYGCLALNWRPFYYAKYPKKSRRDDTDITNSLVITGDFHVLNYLSSKIIEIIETIENTEIINTYIKDKLDLKNLGYGFCVDVLKQMVNAATELRRSLLDGKMYASYLLLRNISENLARFYFLFDALSKLESKNKKDVLFEKEQLRLLILAYIVSSFYQVKYRKIPKDKNYFKEIEKIKDLQIEDNSINIESFFNMFEFQQKHKIPMWQVDYGFIKENLNEKLGLILEITIKVVHGNVVLPPIPSILEFKYFKYLLAWFLEVLLEFSNKFLGLDFKIEIGNLKGEYINFDKIYRVFISLDKTLLENIYRDITKQLENKSESVIHALKLITYDIRDICNKSLSFTYLLYNLEKYKESVPRYLSEHITIYYLFTHLIEEIYKMLCKELGTQLNEEELKTLSVAILHSIQSILKKISKL